jgi:hypothetical protein
MPSAACIPDVLDRRVVSLERLEVLDQIIPLAVTQRQMQDRRVVGYDRELRVVGPSVYRKRFQTRGSSSQRCTSVRHLPIPSGEDTGDTNDRIDLQDSVVGRIIEVGGAILDN